MGKDKDSEKGPERVVAVRGLTVAGKRVRPGDEVELPFKAARRLLRRGSVQRPSEAKSKSAGGEAKQAPKEKPSEAAPAGKPSEAPSGGLLNQIGRKS